MELRVASKTIDTVVIGRDSRSVDLPRRITVPVLELQIPEDDNTIVNSSGRRSLVVEVSAIDYSRHQINSRYPLTVYSVDDTIWYTTEDRAVMGYVQRKRQERIQEQERLRASNSQSHSHS